MVVLCLIGVIELDVFSYQSVRFLCDESDLTGSEVLSVEGGHLEEVSQVPLDTGFGMVGLLLDVGEGVSLEVEIHDDGLVRKVGSHVLLGAPSHAELSLVPQVIGIASYRGRTGGEEHREILIAEQCSLIVSLSGYPRETMPTQAGQSIGDQRVQACPHVSGDRH